MLGPFLAISDLKISRPVFQNADNRFSALIVADEVSDYGSLSDVMFMGVPGRYRTVSTVYLVLDRARVREARQVGWIRAQEVKRNQRVFFCGMSLTWDVK